MSGLQGTPDPSWSQQALESTTVILVEWGDPRRVIIIHLKIIYPNSIFLKILSYFIDFSQPLSNNVVTQNTYEISTHPSLHTYIELTGQGRKGRGAYTLHTLKVGGTW